MVSSAFKVNRHTLLLGPVDIMTLFHTYQSFQLDDRWMHYIDPKLVNYIVAVLKKYSRKIK